MTSGRHSRRHVTIDEAAVIAAYEANATVAAICATHRISRDALYRTLDRYDVPRRRLIAPRLPKRQRERILADHAAGHEDAEIARRHSVAPITVARVVARHGGP